MRKLKLGLASLAAVAVLAGCSSATTLTDASGQTTTRSTAIGNSGSSEALTALLSENQESHYSQDDSDYDESSVTQITLNGSSATASGSGVTVDGSTVTITSAGTYRLAGSLTGQVIVNADSQDVKLILNGVELTNPSGSPMVVTAADEVTLILADGTENTISDADTSGDNPQDSPSPAAPSRSIRRATGSIPMRPGRSRGAAS